MAVQYRHGLGYLSTCTSSIAPKGHKGTLAKSLLTVAYKQPGKSFPLSKVQNVTFPKNNDGTHKCSLEASLALLFQTSHVL